MTFLFLTHQGHDDDRIYSIVSRLSRFSECHYLLPGKNFSEYCAVRGLLTVSIANPEIIQDISFDGKSLRKTLVNANSSWSNWMAPPDLMIDYLILLYLRNSSLQTAQELFIRNGWILVSRKFKKNLSCTFDVWSHANHRYRIVIEPGEHLSQWYVRVQFIDMTIPTPANCQYSKSPIYNLTRDIYPGAYEAAVLESFWNNKGNVRYDVAVCSDFPMLGFASYLKDKGLVNQIWLDMHEIWSEQDRIWGTVSRYTKCREVERDVVSKADIITGVAKTFCSLASLLLSKEVVELGVDHGSSGAPDTTLLSGDLHAFFLRLDFIVLFVGSLTSNRNLDVLIDVAKKLPHSAGLLICGDGPERESLAKQMETANCLRNVFFTGNVDKHVLSTIVKRCNLGLIPYKSSDFYMRTSMPNKVSDYLCGGLPFVFDRSMREIAYIEAVYGICFGCTGGFNDIIHDLIENPDRISKAAAGIKNYYQASREKVDSQYDLIYKRLGLFSET